MGPKISVLATHRSPLDEEIRPASAKCACFCSLRSRILTLVCAVSASSALLFAAGCASETNFSGNTHATLLITATNNAQISIFKFNLQGLTLVASDGTSIPVLTTPQLVELGSISGVARPLVVVDVPQGTYTAIKLTYAPSTFVVIDRSAGPGPDEGLYDILTPGDSPVTVEQQLITPLTISGSAMGLLLNLNIPKSTIYTPYYLPGSSSLAPDAGNVTFNPVISLSAVPLAAQPSTLQDGKVEDVHGQVTAISGSVLTMAADSGVPLSFVTSSSTTFAGPNGAVAPPVGSFVDVDAALQADGSMLATLVQTESLTQQYNMVGQLLYSDQLYLESTGREQQGRNLPNGTGFYYNDLQLAPSTRFEIVWPNGAIPAGLPFTPSLNSGSIVPGQNLATPLDFLQTWSTIFPTTNVVTLEPQTINGTVTQVSAVNGQPFYQVNLFSNDFITLFGPAQSVVVYTTAGTHMITSSTLTSGSIGGFRGLLFNDGGTLRMVATEIEDGVPGP